MIITAQRSCLALVYAEKYMPLVVAHKDVPAKWMGKDYTGMNDYFYGG